MCEVGESFGLGRRGKAHRRMRVRRKKRKRTRKRSRIKKKMSNMRMRMSGRNRKRRNMRSSKSNSTTSTNYRCRYSLCNKPYRTEVGTTTSHTLVRRELKRRDLSGCGTKLGDERCENFMVSHDHLVHFGQRNRSNLLGWNCENKNNSNKMRQSQSRTSTRCKP